MNCFTLPDLKYLGWLILGMTCIILVLVIQVGKTSTVLEKPRTTFTCISKLVKNTDLEFQGCTEQY